MKKTTALALTLLAVRGYGIQAMREDSMSDEEYEAIQKKKEAHVNFMMNKWGSMYYETRLQDEQTGTVYYASTNQTDFALLSANTASTAITNALFELNKIYSAQLGKGEYSWTTFPEYQAMDRRIARLRNDLYDLGAIPMMRNNSWHDGMALAANGFKLPDNVREALVSLNWHEQNTNPSHVPVYGTNAVEAVKSKGLEWYRRYIFETGEYRVQFDRRFNLWRITEKYEFDEKGSLLNKQPQEQEAPQSNTQTQP